MGRAAELEEMVTAAVRRNSITGGSQGIPRDANLFLLGVLDSLSVVTLVAELETVLGCTIPAEELLPENFRSVEGIAALCARLSPGGAGGGAGASGGAAASDGAPPEVR